MLTVACYMTDSAIVACAIALPIRAEGLVDGCLCLACSSNWMIQLCWLLFPAA